MICWSVKPFLRSTAPCASIQYTQSIARAAALLSPREQAALARLLAKWGTTIQAREG